MTRTNRLNREKTGGSKPVLRDGNGRFVKGSASPSSVRPSLDADVKHREVVRKTISPDMLADLLFDAYQDAKGGDKVARDQIFKVCGLYTQNIDVTSDGNELLGLTADHLHMLNNIARQQVALWEAERSASQN